MPRFIFIGLSYNRRGTKSGPLFLFENGQSLSRVKLVSLVREALSSVGMDVLKYCGHSFRIGAATTALRAGISDAPRLKCWAGGRAQHTRCTCRLQGRSLLQFLLHWPTPLVSWLMNRLPVSLTIAGQGYLGYMSHISQLHFCEVMAVIGLH